MAEPKKRWPGDFRAYEGKKIGWTEKSRQNKGGTGWKYEGGKWVQYLNGEKTGRTSKTRLGTTAISTLNKKQYNQPTANLNQSNKTKKNNNNKKGSSSNTGITFKQAIKATAKGTGIKVHEGKLYNLKNREELTAYNKAKKASLSGKTNESSNRNKLSSNKKGDKKGNNFTTTVHTRHYKTGERLGVMSRNQRRAYEKQADGRTFEGQVAEHEKKSGHGKPHLRETKYKASVRKGKTTNGSKNRKNLTIKEQHQIKLKEQQQTTAKQMQGDPRYQGPPFKKKKG